MTRNSTIFLSLLLNVFHRTIVCNSFRYSAIKRKLVQLALTSLSKPYFFLSDSARVKLWLGQQNLSHMRYNIIMITFWTLADNEHLLSGQLDELASDVTVLVFETDEIPCRDIVRLVYGSSHAALFWLSYCAVLNHEGTTFIPVREESSYR